MIFLLLLSLVHAQDSGASDGVFNVRNRRYNASFDGTFTNCTFNKITAAVRSGALSLEPPGEDLIVKNFSLDSCSTTHSHGGAIFCSNISTLIFRSNCTFTGCSSSERGGAIGTETVFNCFFMHSCEILDCRTGGSFGGGMLLAASPHCAVIYSCQDRKPIDQPNGAVLRDLIVSNCACNFPGEGFLFTTFHQLDCSHHSLSTSILTTIMQTQTVMIFSRKYTRVKR